MKPFIFSPGVWRGEGMLTFPLLSDKVKFYTQWEITQVAPGKCTAVQTVEMEGLSEQVINRWLFLQSDESSFSLELESASLGQQRGVGGADDSCFSWEVFGDVKGHERYEQQGEEWHFDARYGADDLYCTLVQGRLWRI